MGLNSHHTAETEVTASIRSCEHFDERWFSILQSYKKNISLVVLSSFTDFAPRTIWRERHFAAAPSQNVVVKPDIDIHHIYGT